MSLKTAPTPTNGSVHKSQPEVAYQVLKTFNYSLFKFMGDNRNVNLLHVSRLIQSFKEKHLVCPLIVNEKYEVIDGQHRLHACIETGMPVYYIKIQGYGINEVQQLNTNQKNWNKIDYLHSFCSEGKKPYLEFQEFMNTFPDFQIKAAERIIALKSSADRKTGKNAVNMRDFENGKLVIPNITRSYIIARRISELKPFFEGYNNGTFVAAIIPLLIKSKSYNHKEMLHKLSNWAIRLTVCNDVASYRILLEDIFNYKRQKENKVSFKYE